MHLWLDTIDEKAIAEALKCSEVAGVTTNPTILSKARDVSATLKTLLKVQPGHLAVQVTTDTAEEIYAEAKSIATYSERIIIKIPVTEQGLIAMRKLKKEQIPIMGTAVLFESQAYLASLLNITYISPYFSHLENPVETIKKMLTILSKSQTKLLVASVKTLEQLLSCSQLDVEAITIKPELYQQLLATPASVKIFLEKFSTDWLQGPNHTISLHNRLTSKLHM